jgi:hypothetical protein
MHLRRVQTNLFGVLAEQDLEGNRNPEGGAAEAEERVAAGRRFSPEAVTEEAGLGDGRQIPEQSFHLIPGVGSSPPWQTG